MRVAAGVGAGARTVDPADPSNGPVPQQPLMNSSGPTIAAADFQPLAVAFDAAAVAGRAIVGRRRSGWPSILKKS